MAMPVPAAFNGPTTRALAFLASLTCASLPVTGFFIWWNKRRKKPKIKHSKANSVIKPAFAE